MQPFLSRQESIQRIKDNPVGTNAVSGGLLCCNMPIAIAAVIIASQYDAATNLCAEGDYVIELQSYLYICSFIQIAQIGLFLLNSCCNQWLSFQRKLDNLKMIIGLSILLSIYYVIWASIGFYIYDQQMSEECHSEAISKLLLAYSVYNVIMFGSQICCIGCTLGLVSLSYLALESALNDEEQTERSPLFYDADNET